MIVEGKLTPRRITAFWSPLAATWLMMAFEGPFLAAVIARLPDAKFNLAAYGVAFAFAVIVEAPVIMIMSASTALADSPHNFRKLRTFLYALNALVTLGMVVVLLPPVFDLLVRRLIGIPTEVADLTHTALLLFLPWPAAIGFRRFYQGLLIRDNLTRRVAYGTVVRMVSVTVSALLLATLTDLSGAAIGALSQSIAVVLESYATRLMARETVRRLFVDCEACAEGEVTLSYGGIATFYYPLALTSVISLAVHPVVTFFLGRARFPIESLAVMPVLNSLTFIFRSIGLSFQEVVIALLGPKREHFAELVRFGLLLAFSSAAAYALIAWTPLVTVWFETISGLEPGLAGYAITPARILPLLPALAVLLSAQRGFLVHARTTGAISRATLVEMAGIVLFLMIGIHLFDLIGATAAAAAFLLGRIAGNLYLVPPCARELRS